jgi:hypothetical protein
MPSYRLEHRVNDRVMASVRFARASDDGARLAVILAASRIGLFADQATDQALTLSSEGGAEVFAMTSESMTSGLLQHHG